MIDIEKYQEFPGPANNERNFLSCGAPATSTEPAIVGNQGISMGWADAYVWQLAGQYFVLDGGDGQDPVPPGTYTSGSLSIRRSWRDLASRVLSRTRLVFAINFRNSITLTT